MSEHQESLNLLRRWNAGDREALAGLLDRHLEWVRQHVQKRLGPQLRGKAETLDYVQEAVVDFMEYGPRFELANEKQLRALLARIVENNLRDENKRLHRKRRDIAREGNAASDTILRLDPAVESVATPSRIVDREERRSWIRLALELLEDEDRSTLYLREWEGLGFAEIGERLGIGENGARMRYRRALPKLAKKVGELREGGLRAAGLGETPLA